MQPYSERRPVTWILFVLSALVTVGFFFIPAFIIRPFSHQSAAGLSVAMALRQRAPWVTAGTGLVCLLLALMLWSDPIGFGEKWRNWTRKIVVSAVMLLVAFSAVMARLNYFEWMFHPVPSAQFDAEAASKLDKGEMILAVRFGNDARAYPIREMAYHHILNDVVAGVPIAVTY